MSIWPRKFSRNKLTSNNDGHEHGYTPPVTGSPPSDFNSSVKAGGQPVSHDEHSNISSQVASSTPTSGSDVFSRAVNKSQNANNQSTADSLSHPQVEGASFIANTSTDESDAFSRATNNSSIPPATSKFNTSPDSFERASNAGKAVNVNSSDGDAMSRAVVGHEKTPDTNSASNMSHYQIEHATSGSPTDTKNNQQPDAFDRASARGNPNSNNIPALSHNQIETGQGVMSYDDQQNALAHAASGNSNEIAGNMSHYQIEHAGEPSSTTTSTPDAFERAVANGPSSSSNSPGFTVGVSGSYGPPNEMPTSQMSHAQIEAQSTSSAPSAPNPPPMSHAQIETMSTAPVTPPANVDQSDAFSRAAARGPAAPPPTHNSSYPTDEALLSSHGPNFHGGL